MAPKFLDVMRNMLSPKKAEAAPAAPEAAIEYKGYSIRAAPQQQGGQWTTEGIITKDFPDGAKESHFIRAEKHPDRNDAVSFSVVKAKLIIDQQGDQMFGKGA